MSVVLVGMLSDLLSLRLKEFYKIYSSNVGEVVIMIIIIIV